MNTQLLVLVRSVGEDQTETLIFNPAHIVSAFYVPAHPFSEHTPDIVPAKLHMHLADGGTWDIEGEDADRLRDALTDPEMGVYV